MIKWRDKAWALHVGALGKDACTPQDQRFLTLALAGEVGEFCNLVKKAWRQREYGIPSGKTDDELLDEMRGELADCQIYLTLLALVSGVDLEHACETKMNEVVQRKQYDKPEIRRRLEALR